MDDSSAVNRRRMRSWRIEQGSGKGKRQPRLAGDQQWLAGGRRSRELAGDDGAGARTQGLREVLRFLDEYQIAGLRARNAGHTLDFDVAVADEAGGGGLRQSSQSLGHEVVI